MNKPAAKPTPRREVIADNERAARQAFELGDNVSCFLLIHALVEGLLKDFLQRHGKCRFKDLIDDYRSYVKSMCQGPEFVAELTAFNKRRNRVVHDLWAHGYTWTNSRQKLVLACQAGMIMYGLFVEWLETFDPSITEVGYHYDT